MSNRIVTLIGALVIAGAVWVAATYRTGSGPSAAAAGPTAWVATAHQRGVVGYRDPAVAVSPGGRLVAYSEGRQLRVALIGGGVDVASFIGEGQIRHLAWVDDLRVIFEDGAADDRWRLHEIGVGTRALWPTLDLSGGDASAGVTVRANSLRQMAVRDDGAWVAAIAATSEGPELWRIRLDGQDLTRVTVAGRPSWPAWTPGGEVACVLATPDGNRISSPCGAAPLETTPALEVSGPIAFAPDGASIYTAASNVRGFVDLWRVDRATRVATRVTSTARDSYGPTFARDGALVYKTQEYRVFLGELRHGAVRPLTTFQSETPWWHPTLPLLSTTFGTWRRQIDDVNYPDIAQELGVIDTSAALPADRPTQILEDSDSEDQAMAWSPNGRWIAFHSHREQSDDMWLRPTDGKAPDRRITMLGRGAEVGWPRWAPNGKTLLLDGANQAGESVMFTIGVDQDTGQVTSELNELAAKGFEITHGEWLPDGSRVVAIAKEGPGRHAVLLMPATGGPAQVLHRFATEHDFPGLSVAPDGSAFTFVAPASDGYFQLFRRALDGGPVEQLTFDPSNKSQPAWSPDGTRLAFTTWSYDAKIWRVAP